MSTGTPIDQEGFDWLEKMEPILATKARSSYAQFKYWQETMLADRKRHDACQAVIKIARAEMAEMSEIAKMAEINKNLTKQAHKN